MTNPLSLDAHEGYPLDYGLASAVYAFRAKHGYWPTTATVPMAYVIAKPEQWATIVKDYGVKLRKLMDAKGMIYVGPVKATASDL